MQRDRSSTHHRSADDNTKHTQLFHVTSSLFFLRRKDISLLRHVIDLNQLLMPSVYTFWGNQGPSIMTISSALADKKRRRWP
jgi:hypothetical protein